MNQITRWRVGAGWRAIAVAMLLLIGVPSRALAHVHLEQSVPAAGATLDTPPDAIRLTFNESVAIAVTGIEVRDEHGATVAILELQRQPDKPHMIVAPLKAALAPGRYTVRWHTVADDGHPARGEFAFTLAGQTQVLAPPASESAARAPQLMPAPDTAAAGFGELSPIYVIIRWIAYLATAVLIGVVALRLLIAPRVELLVPAVVPEADAATAATRRLGVVAAITLVLAQLARLVAQLAALSADGPISITAVLLHTLWGQSWLGGLVASVAALVLASTMHPNRGTWMRLGIAVATIALSFALESHAAGEHSLTLILADALHVLAMGGWIGTLLVLVFVALPATMQSASAERIPAAAALVRTFSPVALSCAAVLVVTGGLAAWSHLGSLPALWQSTYGRTLMLKLGVLVGVLSVGAFNWQVLRPRMRDEIGVSAVRRSATLEVALAIIVLGITSVLVATAPPDKETPQPAARAHLID